MKAYSLLAPVLFFLSFMAVNASACETRNVSAAGNLDAGTTALPNGLADVPAYLFATFEDFSQASALEATTSIFDSLSQQHVLHLYFFRYREAPQSAWYLRIAIDGGDTCQGTAGMPFPVTDADLIFAEDGTRANASENGTPDATGTICWRNGAAISQIAVRLQLTQVFAASALTSLTQDGSGSACPQYGHLDFDGDGNDDFAIWRRQTGMWAILKSSVNNADFIWKQWGLPGDHPMAGDYTGDGKADLVVWRPGNGTWYICSSAVNLDCASGTAQQFGLPGDRPLRGDYDKDGTLDVAVWRPTFGFFIFKGSRTGEVVVRQWGLPGDIPLDTDPNQ